MPESVARAVEAHIAQYPPAAVTLPWRSVDGSPAPAAVFFRNAEGRPVIRTVFNEKAWRPAQYLGHRDPGFTLRTYTHLMPSSEKRTREAVNRASEGGPDADDGPTTAQAALILGETRRSARNRRQ
ncbi:hypothetical protein ACFWZJ_33975 [Streptomyces massasporeus]